jgi:hypothetical protein
MRELTRENRKGIFFHPCDQVNFGDKPQHIGEALVQSSKVVRRIPSHLFAL